MALNFLSEVALMLVKLELSLMRKKMPARAGIVMMC